jgi:hypothetical protein
MKFSNYLAKEIQSVGEWVNSSKDDVKNTIKKANGNLNALTLAYSKISLGFYGYETEY